MVWDSISVCWVYNTWVKLVGKYVDTRVELAPMSWKAGALAIMPTWLQHYGILRCGDHCSCLPIFSHRKTLTIDLDISYADIYALIVASHKMCCFIFAHFTRMCCFTFAYLTRMYYFTFVLSQIYKLLQSMFQIGWQNQEVGMKQDVWSQHSEKRQG